MLHHIEQGITVDRLEPCGTLEDMGAEVLEGDNAMFAKGTFGTDDDPVSAGYFGARKSRFRLLYTFHEQAVVTCGEAVLINEATGEKSHYKAGDGWFVAKGTSVLWEILSDSFTKHYIAVG